MEPGLDKKGFKLGTPTPCGQSRIGGNAREALETCGGPERSYIIRLCPRILASHFG